MLGRERPRRRVGDRVVRQHGEGAEADRPAQIGDQYDHRDDSADGELGMVRNTVAGVNGVEPSRQLAVGRHRERGAADTDDERQQHAERGDGAADAHDRRQRVERTGPHDRVERRRRGGQCRRPDRQQRGHGDRGVDDERDPERERDRTRDGLGRVDDLLAECGQSCVAGEGEEQQTGGLQDAGPAADCGEVAEVVD